MNHMIFTDFSGGAHTFSRPNLFDFESIYIVSGIIQPLKVPKDSPCLPSNHISSSDNDPLRGLDKNNKAILWKVCPRLNTPASHQGQFKCIFLMMGFSRSRSLVRICCRKLFWHLTFMVFLFRFSHWCATAVIIFLTHRQHCCFAPFSNLHSQVIDQLAHEKRQLQATISHLKESNKALQERVGTAEAALQESKAQVFRAMVF